MSTVRLWRHDHGAGEPLVLVHGFTGSHRDWEGVVDELAATRRVITFDHRGHGDSPNTGDPATYTFDQLLADGEALFDELGLERIDLLGHSMGGIVAMRYVLAHPERVRSLVLMDTGARPSGDGVSGWMQAGIDVVRRDGLAALTERILPFLPEDQRERVRWSNECMDPVAFVALAEELFTYPSMLDDLASLTVPTTVIVGEDDTGLRAAADDLAATIPGAVFELIPAAGHPPQLENRAAWLHAVQAHLARAGSPT